MSKSPLYLFGDIVVVEENLIGVVVKTWENFGASAGYTYEVYVRMKNKILTYREKDIARYRVRHKYLNEEELEYQNG